MKILYVAHSFPFPIHEGIRLRVYHLLKELSKRHEIHLLCFAFSEDEKKNLPEISPFCKSITTIVHEVPKAPWQRILSMLFDGVPFCIRQFYSSRMEQAVKEASAAIKPGVVHFDHTPMAQYEKFIPKEVPRVFVPHDALSMLFKSSYCNERHPMRKFYFWNQYLKIRHYERSTLPLFDKTVVVSPVDQAYLREISPEASIEWSPNGVDCDFFHEYQGRERGDVVLFRGIMDFFPNHDAALFFAESVMPLIWRKRKDVEFWVAGHNPLKPLRKLADKESRIKLLGFVNDLRDPMAEATVVVSPMQSGSGIKNKVLESLAMGKAAVSTSLGLAGINVESGKHLLVGETAEELARQTLHLLENGSVRKELGQAGREFVKIHHSWAEHAAFFARIYLEKKRKDFPKP